MIDRAHDGARQPYTCALDRAVIDLVALHRNTQILMGFRNRSPACRHQTAQAWSRTSPSRKSRSGEKRSDHIRGIARHNQTCGPRLGRVEYGPTRRRAIVRCTERLAVGVMSLGKHHMLKRRLGNAPIPGHRI